MNLFRILLAPAFAAAVLSLTSCDEATLAAISAAGNSQYNQPPRPYYAPSYYQAPPAYSPYASDYREPSPAQRQHTFDVGYRVGQDDYRHGLKMSTSRHQGLYDRNTEDAFRSGYSSGYNQAKARDKR